ncbi:hypothetical protein B9479_007642 [Cryptococcus floricola]|uniref:SGT1-domain-containing protein n=1 Tax=Cryptococcus floricola TaxID=2591691 RepID=A0A5D3AP21_9TREE|nr:hypothetical protein B9479_007642 [Cryptococcus floricola]
MSVSFPSLSHSHSAFPLPQVPEDTLHYTIHLPTSYSDPSATALLINQYVHTLLRHPWLWNKDSWELKVADSDSERSSEGPKLEGRMRVGDAVDDEWLVVWLLREVSRKWPELIISIRDTDGEFLLIEAANELPSWVSPDNADNRLWLQGAHLHLIPLSVRSAAAPHQLSDDIDSDPAIHLSESDALRAVRTGKYPASKAVEQAVWQRIAGYPDAMRTHLHRTNIYLPLAVAKALRQQPDLVQKAVEAFYVRDPAQLRAASRMTHFPPSPAVLTDITLTRAAYAQLQGQVFHAPRVFGPEWHVRDGADQGSESSPEKLDDQRRWRDLGVKVATGFEIMYREGGKSSRTGAQASNEVTQGPEYQTFLADLKRSGWFGEELEGSQKWKEREEEARKGYAEVKSADVASQRPSFAYLVDNAVSSSTLSSEDLTASVDTPEDDDKWLEVSPDELDGLMLRASGQDGTKGAPGNEERMEVGEEHGQMLGDLAKKVQDFVGGQGDMQGARFLDELSDEDMDSGSDSEEDEELQAHKKQLESEKQSRLSNLVPNLAAEEWGHKTSKPPAPKPNTDPAAAAQPTQTEKKANPLDFIPSTMRPPRFAKQEFDGVVSDSDDDDDDDGQLPAEGTWGRKIAQMKWGDFPPVDGEDDAGVAKIEEIEEDEDEQGRKEKLVLEDEALEEQMKRRVWGEDEAEEDEDDEMPEDIEDVEMEGEGDETQKFLDFSREALGISDEMWEGILQERKDRGSFVPELKKKEKIAAKEEDGNFEDKPTKAGRGKKVQFSEEKVEVAPEPGQPNASLDSFDSVMRAMDEALAQSRPSAPAPAPIPGSKAPKKSKFKVSSANPLPPAPPGEDIDFDNFDEDDLLAMDRELRSVLVGAGVDPDALSDDDDDDPEEVGMLDGEGRKEYEMMKNFLESWKSQGGESGAVGNLFGRLAQDKK